MKKTLIICPTYRQAIYAWKIAQEAMPSLWTKATKNPITLTSVNGNQYIFEVDSSRKLMGWKSDILIFDEFIGMFDKLKKENS